MTETNLNLVLTNALKCSSELAVKVADLYASGNKCADSEFAKLKLLIDRIEALTSYGFDETVVTTIQPNTCYYINYNLQRYKFISYIPTTSDYLVIYLNSLTNSYTIYGDGILNTQSLLVKKLTELGILIEEFCNNFCTIYTLYLTCSDEVLRFDLHYTEDSVPLVLQYTNAAPPNNGVCETTTTIAKNCLKEEEADDMMHKIMHECNICDCQLIN